MAVWIRIQEAYKELNEEKTQPKLRQFAWGDILGLHHKTLDYLKLFYHLFKSNNF
jgi:hypothetical protein